jgi:hypothetical protein
VAANNIRSKTIDKENCTALFSVIDNSLLRRKRPIGVVHNIFHYIITVITTTFFFPPSFLMHFKGRFKSTTRDSFRKLQRRDHALCRGCQFKNIIIINNYTPAMMWFSIWVYYFQYRINANVLRIIRNNRMSKIMSYTPTNTRSHASSHIIF